MANNLPIIFMASHMFESTPTNNQQSEDTSLASFLSSEETNSSNLSSSQWKLLRLHCKTGHQHFAKLQQLIRNRLGTCDPPICKSCIYGKQHQCAIPSDSSALDTSHLSPGDCIFGDQVKSTTPGLVPTYKGTPTSQRYHTGTPFVDHAIRYLHFTPHFSTGCQESLLAKHNVEMHASHHNISIKCYHTKNGIFSSKDFRNSCTQQHQQIKFCGVNTHHQNAIAEQYICSITECAHTMLIHALISWPDTISEQLWPYALQLATDLHNDTPWSIWASSARDFYR